MKKKTLEIEDTVRLEELKGGDQFRFISPVGNSKFQIGEQVWEFRVCNNNYAFYKSGIKNFFTLRKRRVLRIKN